MLTLLLDEYLEQMRWATNLFVIRLKLLINCVLGLINQVVNRRGYDPAEMSVNADTKCGGHKIS